MVERLQRPVDVDGHPVAVEKGAARDPRQVDAHELIIEREARRAAHRLEFRAPRREDLDQSAAAMADKQVQAARDVGLFPPALQFGMGQDSAYHGRPGHQLRRRVRLERLGLEHLHQQRSRTALAERADHTLPDVLEVALQDQGRAALGRRVLAQGRRHPAIFLAERLEPRHQGRPALRIYTGRDRAHTHVSGFYLDPDSFQDRFLPAIVRIGQRPGDPFAPRRPGTLRIDGRVSRQRFGKRQEGDFLAEPFLALPGRRAELPRAGDAFHNAPQGGEAGQAPNQHRRRRHCDQRAVEQPYGGRFSGQRQGQDPEQFEVRVLGYHQPR